jgi:hypothetical protein
VVDRTPHLAACEEGREGLAIPSVLTLTATGTPYGLISSAENVQRLNS